MRSYFTERGYTMSGTLLDQYVAALQNQPPWNIWKVNPDGTIEPWFEVTGQIVRELVIATYNVEDQVAAVSAQIQFWGNLASQAQRIWEIEDRTYRSWRDGRCLEFITPPAGESEDDDKAKWKRPTEKQIDWLVRTHKDYPAYYRNVERAAAAYRSTESVVAGFKAKSMMLEKFVKRHREGGLAQLSV